MSGRTIHQFMGLKVILNPNSGYYEVPVPVAGSKRNRWISTGAKTLEKAKESIEKSGVDRLIGLANAGALTESALAVIMSGRKVTCDEILEAWLTEIGEHLAPRTVEVYRIHVNALFDYANCHARPLATLDRSKINAYVNRTNIRHSSACARLAAIKSLYRYARSYNYVVQDLASTVFIRVRDMTIEQLEKRVIYPMTEAEYRTIVESPRVSLFWRVSTTISYWTALRFVDCASLEWASITPDFLIVWTKKRGKRVALPLDDPLLGAGELRRALDLIPRADPTYCFPVEHEALKTKKRNKFPTAYKKILNRLGIDMKSFHSNRHSAISRMRIAGMSLEQIGRAVGHSSTATTELYVHPAGTAAQISVTTDQSASSSGGR